MRNMNPYSSSPSKESGEDEKLRGVTMASVISGFMAILLAIWIIASLTRK